MSDVNNKVDKVKLEWGYEPVQYHEESFSLEANGIEIKMDNGTASAEIPPSFLPQDRSLEAVHKYLDDLSKKLADTIKSYLIAVQLLTDYASISLSQKPARRFTLERGKKLAAVDVNMVAHSRFTVEASVSVPESKMKKSQEEQKNFALLICKTLEDATFKQLLQSYEDAFNNPQYMLSHLYEIREALKKKFGSENKAIDQLKNSDTKKELGISYTKWEKLGKLCNDPDLKEGRHKGNHDPEKLRDAKPEELQKAREISRDLIKGYVYYLEKNPPNKSS